MVRGVNETDIWDKYNTWRMTFSGLQGCEFGIYCLIDEYDNFTNTILAESGQAAYDALCHGGL